MIKIDIPKEWDLRVDDRWDGVQVGPLAISVVCEHINNCLITDRDPRNTIMNFPSSKQVKILEFGGGHSTVFFATTFPTVRVCAMEGEKMWYDREMEWKKERNLQNMDVIFEDQPSDYGFDSPREDNMNYVERSREFGPPFDLILNDGAMREKVSDYIFTNADKYLTVGGLYLRHDYYRAVSERWIGPHITPHPPWVTSDVGTFHEEFCTMHPNYRTVTVPGNWRPGFYEYGGIWRIK